MGQQTVSDTSGKNSLRPPSVPIGLRQIDSKLTKPIDILYSISENIDRTSNVCITPQLGTLPSAGNLRLMLQLDQSALRGGLHMTFD